MAPPSYVTVFDFMGQAPPSVLPLVGMLIVGAVGVILVLFGKNAPSRVIGALIAVVAAGVGATGLLGARSDYNQIRSDITAERVQISEGILHVAEHGQFNVGAETFALPIRPGTRRIYALNPDEIARLEGMCAQVRFTSSRQVTRLGVRELSDNEC